VKIYRRRGRLILEFTAVLRIPILLEPIALTAAQGISLTKREQMTLDAILKGMQNKEIAAALNLSVRTVKFHVTGVLRKFGVQSRGELQHLFTK
jgi:DNA-binding NarL/FixJ family response regulator